MGEKSGWDRKTLAVLLRTVSTPALVSAEYMENLNCFVSDSEPYSTSRVGPKKNAGQAVGKPLFGSDPIPATLI